MTIEEIIQKRVSSTFKGIEIIDSFAISNDFFQQNLEYLYANFDVIIQNVLNEINNIYTIYSQIPAYQLDELIRRELEQIEDTTALTAYLFNRMNVFNVNLIQLQNQLIQKDEQLQQAKEYLIKQQNIIKDLEETLRQRN